MVTVAALAMACGSSAAPEDGSAVPDEAASPVDRSGSPESGSLSRRRARVTVPVSPSSATWRVLSFNINYGVGHDPVNLNAVAEADADLVLLQETTDESEQAFREALSDRYPHILFRQCCNAGGLGVLSKHPIAEDDYLPPTVGWFPAWRVVVDTPVGRVQALNVHLRPPMSDGGSWVAGYFTTRGVRLEEMAEFWEYLDASMPTIVAGDFNENASGKAVRFLGEQGLRSALAELHPRAKTWHWQTRAGEIRGMLDHVMVGDGLRLHDAQVLDEGTSDHFPVLVVLGAES